MPVSLGIISPIETACPYLFCTTRNTRLTEGWVPKVHCQDKTHLVLTGLTFIAVPPEICLSRHFMPELVNRTREEEIWATIYCYKEKWISKSRGLTEQICKQSLYKKLGTCPKPIAIKEPQEYWRDWIQGALFSQCCFLYSGGSLDGKTMK